MIKIRKSQLPKMKADMKAEALKKAHSGKQRSSGSPNIETKPEYVSMIKVIRGITNGDWTDAEHELKLCKALNTEIGTQGGFAFPTQLSTEVIELVQAKAIIRNLPGVRKIKLPKGVRTLEMNRIDAGPVVSWGGENTTIASDTTTALGRVALDLNKAVCLVPLSREMVAAGNPSVDDFVKADLAEKLGIAEDLALLEGTGGNQPLGFYYNPLVTSTDLSGAADFDNFADAAYQVKLYNRAVTAWVGHPRVENSLRKLKDAEGRYLWKDGTTIVGGQIAMPTILGLPFHQTTTVPITTRPGSNETYVVGGDWSDLVLGDGDNIRIETTTEGSGAFALDQLLIKAVKEVDALLRHHQSFAIIKGMTA